MMATIVCAKTRPQMCTVRPGVMKKPERNPDRIGTPVSFEASNKKDQRVMVTETVKSIKEEAYLKDAGIICAGGRGLAGRKGFDLLKELAAAVGGAVGGTRGLVDMGLIEESRMIGQTGAVVRPKIYFACGISGAMQHISGIQESDCIIAINKDPDAPIFSVADYVIVGDVLEVLPEITKAWK